MTVLQLEKLSLTNFRCFARCEIDLHPKLTVLVAENGSGKTAVLDAAAAALSVFVNTLYPHERGKRIDRSDVRLVPGREHEMVPCLPTEYQARGIVLDAPVTWGSTVNKVRPSRVNLKPLQLAAQNFRSNEVVLPLIAYYGTGRLWWENRLTGNRRSSITNVEERVTGYADCLTSSSSFKGISAWFEYRMKEITSPAYKESLQANLAMIEGVKTAADKVLKPTGWSNLHWDSNSRALIAEHEKQGSLPLSMLSDGVRTMLALVADVARRCASLNPRLSDQASIQTPGVLLIDEIDMHLHPRWQQQVLGLLRDAFPALQIIITTHSPHVLSTVDKSSIRVLHIKNGEVIVETPLMQTRGVESSSVLASVMDVDPIPQLDESRDLSAYRALIEDGKAEEPEATALRQRLIKHYGESHPLIQDCDRLIRFQQFRLGKAGPEGA